MHVLERLERRHLYSPLTIAVARFLLPKLESLRGDYTYYTYLDNALKIKLLSPRGEWLGTIALIGDRVIVELPFMKVLPLLRQYEAYVYRHVPSFQRKLFISSPVLMYRPSEEKLIIDLLEFLQACRKVAPPVRAGLESSMRLMLAEIAPLLVELYDYYKKILPI